MTRRALTTPTQRLVVGYDPDLATYYIETGPVVTGTAAQEDPDEGLTTIRGRVPGDLPDFPALLTELRSLGGALTDPQRDALEDAASHSPPQRERKADGANGQHHHTMPPHLRRHR